MTMIIVVVDFGLPLSKWTIQLVTCRDYSSKLPVDSCLISFHLNAAFNLTIEDLDYAKTLSSNIFGLPCSSWLNMSQCFWPLNCAGQEERKTFGPIIPRPSQTEPLQTAPCCRLIRPRLANSFHMASCCPGGADITNTYHDESSLLHHLGLRRAQETSCIAEETWLTQSCDLFKGPFLEGTCISTCVLFSLFKPHYCNKSASACLFPIVSFCTSKQIGLFQKNSLQGLAFMSVLKIRMESLGFPSLKKREGFQKVPAVYDSLLQTHSSDYLSYDVFAQLFFLNSVYCQNCSLCLCNFVY